MTINDQQSKLISLCFPFVNKAQIWLTIFQSFSLNFQFLLFPLCLIQEPKTQSPFSSHKNQLKFIDKNIRHTDISLKSSQLLSLQRRLKVDIIWKKEKEEERKEGGEGP